MIYSTAIPMNEDTTPATLTFRDTNNDGKPDMVITVHFSSGNRDYIFLNNGSTFDSSPLQVSF
ncbi:hypothetical protein KSF_059600 [Reticulibacter mediterranei]|uniref:VCBS repeat-containing protein n=1 Tax=Reticulibacter mediterranei TaxID=2778369 RepID=A0A8J3N6B1_9CHLR|nr:hypothetical protein KSF_059600 [Reticulibacter mediterranei]